MKIAIGSDHAGFELKEKIRADLIKKGYDVTDEGTNTTDSVDYPDYAKKVAHDVVQNKVEFGVLVCGSGIGMAISANKVQGIRATTATSEVEAQLCREHNDANIIAVGARLVSEDQAKQIVDRFLHTSFSHGRHEQRVRKIAELEKEEAKANS